MLPRLEFRGMPQLLVAEPAVGIRQAVERSLIESRHFHASFGLQALQPMDSPNFGMRVNVKQGKNVVDISPRNDNYPGPAVTHNLLQEDHNSRIRVCLVALGLEWRQRSVVIEQQHCLGCMDDSLQKWCDSDCTFWPQTLCSFPSAAESRDRRAGTQFFLHVLRRIQAHLAKFGDQVPGPAVDVVLLDNFAHAPHAQFLILRLHL